MADMHVAGASDAVLGSEAAEAAAAEAVADAAAAAEAEGPRRVSGSEIRAFVDQQQRATEAPSHGVDDGGPHAAGLDEASRPAQNAEPEQTERWGDFLPVPMADQYGLKSKRKRSGQGNRGGQRATGGSRFGELPGPAASPPKC